MKIKIFAVVCLLAANLFTISAQKWFTPEAEKQVDALLSQVVEGNYKNNRYPLLRKPLMELPLGSIKPKGWLHEMLVRQKNGASGQMDVLYPSVMGKRNGWLGGDERRQSPSDRSRISGRRRPASLIGKLYIQLRYKNLKTLRVQGSAAHALVSVRLHVEHQHFKGLKLQRNRLALFQF